MELNSYSYNVSYRDVKYPRVELKTGKILFVLPFGYNPDIVYDKYKNWIDKKMKFIKDCLSAAENKRLLQRSENEFRDLIYRINKKLSDDLGVNINKIYFRYMKTKWASLSSRNNITVNRFMKYLPEYLIEYILFHELVHIIEKKHNKRFWKIISKKYGSYNKIEKELFEYWFKLSKSKE